jgi:cobalt-zinc-cadmium efflux system protein
MVAEVVGGVVSGSLALLADAGHMLTDTAALALAFVAMRAARRPENARHTFGQHRLQVLAALINGAALFAITGWIALEAVRRLRQPVEVVGGAMMAVAVLGLLINLGAFAILRGGAKESINLRGAALHALGDLLGSVGAIVAAGVILLTGWTPIDPILSVLVCLLILRSAWKLVAESWHVLMEGAPEGIEIEAIRAGLLAEVAGLHDVHHVHLWALTPEQPVITLHAQTANDANRDELLFGMKKLLRERFGLDHATIQLEGPRFRELLALEAGPETTGQSAAKAAASFTGSPQEAEPKPRELLDRPNSVAAGK